MRADAAREKAFPELVKTQLRGLVNKMVFKEMRPYSISDFLRRARVELSLNLTPRQMTAFLKKDMQLTYHKATTSPLTLNADRRL